MCEGDGEGIRCIGLGCFPELEKSPHHEGYLFFAGGAFADGGKFDAGRRVFDDFETVFSGGQDDGRPGGAHDDGRLVGLDEDDALDGNFFRLPLLNEGGDVVFDREEAGGLGQFGGQ